MKFTPVSDEKRFTEERIKNTLGIFIIVAIPVFILSAYFKWEGMITFFAIYGVIGSISFIIYKIYSYLKNKKSN